MMKSKLKKLLAVICAIAIAATSVNVWNQASPVQAADTNSTEVTPVTLQGFKNITVSNFYDGDTQLEDKTYTTSSELCHMKDAEGNSVESYDKVLLSMKVAFESGSQSITDTRIEVAGKDEEGYLMIYPSASGKSLFIEGKGGMSTDTIYVQITADGNVPAGTDLTDYFFKERLLQLSFEYGDFDTDGVYDDVRLGVYLDGIACQINKGQSYETCILANCDITEKFGNCFKVRVNGKSVTLGSVVLETEEEPKKEYVTLDGFRNITASSFVDSEGNLMEERLYDSTMQTQTFYLNEDSKGNAISSYDKTLLSLKVKFAGDDETEENESTIRILGKDEDSGFMLYPNKAGNALRLETVNQNINTFERRYIKAADLTTGEVNNFFRGKEFTIQISFEYGDFDGDGDSEDVRLGFYYNGVKCDKIYNQTAQFTATSHIMTDCKITETFGTCLVVRVKGHPITITSAGETNTIELDNAFAAVEGLRYITTRTFGDANENSMENKSYTTNSSFNLMDEVGNVLSSNDSYNDTLLSLNLKFASGATLMSASRIEVGGKGDDTAFYIQPTTGGNLYFYPTKWEADNMAQDWGGLVLNAVTAGVTSFINEAFNLQISFEYGDYDNDNGGVEDDLRLGFYVNGKLYDDTHNIIYDCNFSEKFGSCLAVKVINNSPIEISSIVSERRMSTYNEVDVNLGAFNDGCLELNAEVLNGPAKDANQSVAEVYGNAELKGLITITDDTGTYQQYSSWNVEESDTGLSIIKVEDLPETTTRLSLTKGSVFVQAGSKLMVLADDLIIKKNNDTWVAQVATNVILTVGSDETQRNITWYTKDIQDEGAVRYALKSDMVEGEFPVDDQVYKTSDATSTETVPIKTTGTDTLDYSNQATMTGLEANKEYVYQIMDGEKVLNQYYFSTGETESFEFAFVGDPQLGVNEDTTIVDDIASWNDTLEKINNNFDVEFLLSSGDQVNTHSNESHYDAFSNDALASLAIATTIGNHDTSSGVYSEHFNLPNESTQYGNTKAGGDYWFKYGNTLFMNLNSNNLTAAEHKAFMEEAMNANPDVTWKTVVLHHSIYSAGSHAENEDVLSLRNSLVPIFTELDIDIVLMGHDHAYTRSYMMDEFVPDSAGGIQSQVINPTGILYLTASSSTGSKYYPLTLPNADYVAKCDKADRKTVTHVEVTDTSYSLTTYYADTMEVMDTFTIYKTADVNGDGNHNEQDMVEMRKILVSASTIEFYDVNMDDNCDVIDLVSLKKYLVKINKE